MTEILPPDPDGLRRAAAAIRAGEPVAIPTETVYGLAADARSPDAVRRVFAVKGRPARHPVIVHVAGPAALDAWAADVPGAARALAAAFWPGPLTLVLRRAPSVPDAVTGGQDTVGLRCPDHPAALALLAALSGPDEPHPGLAAPSANRFGRVSPVRAADVVEELGDAIGMVLDGGPCEVGLESSIVDLSGLAAGRPPRLLRPGGAPREALERALGRPLAGAAEPDAPGAGAAGASGAAPRAPGTLASHYAPRAAVRLLDAAEPDALRDGAGVVARRPLPPGAPAGLERRWLEIPADPAGYGRALYRALRDLDAAGVDEILVERVPDGPAWEAAADRLRRAAHPARPAASDAASDAALDAAPSPDRRSDPEAP